MEPSKSGDALSQAEDKTVKRKLPSMQEGLNRLGGQPQNLVLAGRYLLQEEVGTGGMGRVFKAQDQRQDSTCAVKVMHNHLKDDKISRKRFEREAELAISLRHDNIVAVSDFGLTEANEPYIVMEYLVGESLAEIIQRQGFLPVEQFTSIFLEVCRGLSYAHGANVVHRDMKPSNIMKTDCGQIKIVDFGIAKACARTGEICPTSASALKNLLTAREIDRETEDLLQDLTQPGEIFGSPLYMSPEQCYGEEADCRSEVYALGCMMYEALTGQTPLRGRNAMETMLKRVHDQPPRLSEEKGERQFPQVLEDLIARCLQKEPDKRFQTALALYEALEQIGHAK